ncbi:MAG TPA: VanW family protein [Clostridia bacterium]|nr:VanW family protein [Clostridia bacterium]
MEHSISRAPGTVGAGGKPNFNRTKRRTKLSRTLKGAKLAFGALAAAFVVVLIVYIFTNKPSQSDMEAIKDDGAFIEGVSVNGMDISGMTYSAAREALLPSVQADMESINITVSHGTMLWLLTAADMKATSMLDEVLTEAIALGRSGTVIENNSEKEDVAANGRSLTVTFKPDEAALKAKLAVIAAALNTMPVEPSATTVTTASEPQFIYNEGKDGYVLDEDAVYQDIADLLSSGDYAATLEPKLNFAKPTASVDDVKAATQLIATFQTSFGGSSKARNEKRVGNIQKASTLLNGMVVKDQEEFNFNAYIGPRTEADGWPLAPGIVNGNAYEDEAGGGICQVSTTLYNALLCAGASMQRGSTIAEVLAANIAGISITERKHHSWPSSYVDTGLDCTVTGTVEAGKSLSFVNNTGYSLYFFVYCDRANYTCTVYIYGKPLPAGITYKVRGVVDRVITSTTNIVYDTAQPADYILENIVARDGYEATAWRDTYLDGVLQSSEELYKDTYNPVTGETIVGTGGAPAPSPAATPKS